MGYLAEPFVSICGEIHARENVLASSTPMGSSLVIGKGANTPEARSSAERQMRLRQLISQDLADDISTDVYCSLFCPTIWLLSVLQ